MIYDNILNVQDGEGDWVSLDAELEMSDGVVTGTRCPTGHYLLIDARFELPFGKFIATLLIYFQIDFVLLVSFKINRDIFESQYYSKKDDKECSNYLNHV